MAIITEFKPGKRYRGAVNGAEFTVLQVSGAGTHGPRTRVAFVEEQGCERTECSLEMLQNMQLECVEESKSAPDGMKHGSFTKVLDFQRDSKDGQGERFIRYDGPHYMVMLSIFPTFFTMTIKPNNDAPRFRPTIYTREDSDYRPIGLVIETISYGALSMGEMREMHEQYRIAMETADIIQKEFIDPLREGTFVFGEYLPRPNE